MLKFIGIAAVLLTLPCFSFALSPKDIAQCAAHRSDGERLICYDSLAKSLGLDKPKVAAFSGKGNWQVKEETSLIDDSKSVYLVLRAETPVADRNEKVYPTMLLRCKDNSTDLIINWNMLVDTKSTEVLQRFDQEEVFQKKWTMSTDQKATFYPDDTSEFVLKMLDHSYYLVQVTPHSGTPVTANFKLDGLSEAIKPLREACKW